MREVQNIPHDYVRQICYLAPSMEGETEQSQENITDQNKQLIQAYKAWQTDRYKQHLELQSVQIKANYAEL